MMKIMKQIFHKRIIQFKKISDNKCLKQKHQMNCQKNQTQKKILKWKIGNSKYKKIVYNRKSNKFILVYFFFKQQNRIVLEYTVYTIQSYVNKYEIDNVQRRFSDFESLYQELVYKYPGIIIPALPEKNVLVKISYLNSFNSEFLEERKIMLTIFLQNLLNHPILRYTKELKSFVMDSQEGYNIQKENNQQLRNQEEENSTGYFQVFYNAYNKISLAFGNSNQKRRRILDDIDVKFNEYQAYYSQQYHKAKELFDILNNIFRCKKQQAESMAQISVVFNEMKNDIDIPQGLQKQTETAGLNQFNQVQNLIKKYGYRLKVYIKKI
ncbi:hypothetical protein IMG5_080920 [Ichthyophthirius multifiliis]|uniref:PX domain-containing protein n=1 Tax=Ichthyophthirius multifiliis TaxID=5932 RepID=G0QQK9_ICHMU|nr:hypothetical protein IMG5_080920 [Ichthyophthirius multifiliis]EGR32493.1 hypothetical protein IMG5_080920 [Ichthyophthirius multifiliis]|eukprot:XP_004036479.1 hypothetical protein IMG5_080920 [Ichthyophthirius multifiliis]